MQAYVEEPRPSDLGRPGERFEIDGGGDLGSQNTRVQLQRLRQRHAAIGLVIAKFGVVSGADRGPEGIGIAALGSRRGESGT